MQAGKMSYSSLWYRNRIQTFDRIHVLVTLLSYKIQHFWGWIDSNTDQWFSFFAFFCAMHTWEPQSVSQMKLLLSPVRPEIFRASPKRSDSVKFVEFATQSAAAMAIIPEQKPPFTMRDRHPHRISHTLHMVHNRIITTFQSVFLLIPWRLRLFWKESKGWENVFTNISPSSAQDRKLSEYL